MSDLLAARAQMGTSLAFHIIFASLGIGLPLLLCIAEGLALWQKDTDWMTLTRRWTKAFALLFAIGAVSGTILSFEIGLLWPTYTRFSGSIIGLPFALEGFGVATVYAIQILRGRRASYYRKGLVLAMALGAIAIPFQIFDGDVSARSLADLQPAKLAAMEGVFHTQQGVPIKVGGIVDVKTGQVVFALEIPHGLSILARGDPNATIIGLDAYAPQDRPDPTFVHPSFDGMVGSGFFALLIGGVFWLFYFRRKRVVPENRLLLWGIVLAGPLSFIAIELGWMVTELGRQPWAIYGILRTQDAVTTAPGLGTSFAVFSVIYGVLAITLTVLLLRLARSPLPKQESPVLVSSADEKVVTK